MKKVTFAVFSDLHLDITPDALGYCREFIRDLSGRKPDFVIQLGDIYVFRPWIEEYFNDPGGFVMKKEYEADFDCHKEYYQRFSEVKKALPELYSVLGNHDHDRADKEYLTGALHIPSPYYDFEVNGFTFIALDTNNYYVDGEFIPYARQNYMRDKRDGKRLDALGRGQLEWLRDRLAAAKGPVTVFSHAPLDTGVCEREELAEIFREATESGTKIVMCVNGHNHIDSLVTLDGIRYWEVNSMTYRFLGRQYPPVYHYGEEMSARYRNIRFGAPYTAPLYAYVTIRGDGYVCIEGREAEYKPPLPSERGFVEHNPKAGGPEILSREFFAF